MRRRLLAALLIVAALSTVSGADAGSPADVTVTCSATVPTWAVGCFAEKQVLEFGPVMVAVGVDAQAVLTNLESGSHLAPYGLVVVTLPTWSAWAEVRLPESVGIPVLGAPDWLRLGVSFGF